MVGRLRQTGSKRLSIGDVLLRLGLLEWLNDSAVGPWHRHGSMRGRGFQGQVKNSRVELGSALLFATGEENDFVDSARGSATSP